MNDIWMTTRSLLGLLVCFFGIGILGGTVLLLSSASASAAETDIPLPSQQWPFKSPLGTFDRAALQRGFQVYIEICSSCHSLKHLRYQDLEDIGYSPDDVTTVAADYQVTAGPDDEGNMFQRPATAQDHFVPPFANENAARAAKWWSLSA